MCKLALKWKKKKHKMIKHNRKWINGGYGNQTQGLERGSHVTILSALRMYWKYFV